MLIKKDDDGNCKGGHASGGIAETVESHDHAKKSVTLIIDAICALADIDYPTDVELCDRAKRWTEIILDIIVHG